MTLALQKGPGQWQEANRLLSGRRVMPIADPLPDRISVHQAGRSHFVFVRVII